MIAAGLALIGFTVGMITAAWIYETDIRTWQTELAQTRRDLRAANQRAAQGAIHVEHARAQREWGGRYQ